LQAERDFSAGILQHPFTTVGKSVQHLLLLNRAATRLRLERYHHSLADSETALQHISELLVLSKGDEMKKAPLLKLQEKGMLRKALSLYGLEKWKLARAAFSTCMDNHPDSDEGRTGLLRASSRIAEHDKGDYDLLNLFKQSQVKPNSRLDVAGFAGPVRVSSFPDMGRGLVTTRDVKAGELLLVNKAIQAVYTEDLPHEILFSLNLLTNAGDKGCTTRLRIALAYKMYWTPELQKAVNGLFSGDNSGQGEAYPLDGTSVDTDSTISYVDPEIIDKVTTYNTFDLHGVKPDCSHDGLSGNDEKLPKNDADTA
jgi:phosphotransferase system IIB component